MPSFTMQFVVEIGDQARTRGSPMIAFCEHGERERGSQLLAEARATAARHLPTGSPALAPFDGDDAN